MTTSSLPRSRWLVFLAWAIFSTLPACAENLPPSLFLSPSEAREAELLADKSAPAGQGDIRLAAIMYYSANDWVLWLRGEKWTPQTSHDDLHVVEVTPDHVRLRWQEDADSPTQEFLLKPNQTYQIATGAIVPNP